MPVEERKANKAASDRRYLAANREKLLEYKRKYYHSNKDKLAELGRAYRRDNKAGVAKQKRQYYLANKEQYRAAGSRQRESADKGAHAEYCRQYYLANKERIKARRAINQERHTRLHREWCKSNLDKIMLTAAKHRSKKAGLPDCNLTLEDVAIPTFCPVLRIPLISSGAHRDNAPTLDRIIPNLGYVKGNVAVISHRANRMKSDSSLAELEAIVAYVKRTGG